MEPRVARACAQEALRVGLWEVEISGGQAHSTFFASVKGVEEECGDGCPGSSAEFSKLAQGSSTEKKPPLRLGRLPLPLNTRDRGVAALPSPR